MRLLSDMEIFVEVARSRNFGRSALLLGINASTLSRRVARLERDLGVVLIRRSTRLFVLTESGRQFFVRAQRIVEDAIRAKDEVSAGFAKVAGSLRVGAPFDFATTVLAPILATFCNRYPAISLDIESSRGQPEMTQDCLDLAFAIAHQVLLPDSRYSARPVGSFARMMYASKSYLRHNGTPTSINEIPKHSCVRYVTDNPEKHWDLHQGSQNLSIPVQGRWSCNSVTVAAQAARNHLGIAMLPEHLAVHPCFGAGLIRVLPEWQGTAATVFAITLDRKLPAKVHELIQAVKNDFTKRIAQLEAAQF